MFVGCEEQFIFWSQGELAQLARRAGPGGRSGSPFVGPPGASMASESGPGPQTQLGPRPERGRGARAERGVGRKGATPTLSFQLPGQRLAEAILRLVAQESTVGHATRGRMSVRLPKGRVPLGPAAAPTAGASGSSFRPPDRGAADGCPGGQPGSSGKRSQASRINLTGGGPTGPARQGGFSGLARAVRSRFCPEVPAAGARPSPPAASASRVATSTRSRSPATSRTRRAAPALRASAACRSWRGRRRTAASPGSSWSWGLWGPRPRAAAARASWRRSAEGPSWS